ncbi:MAG: putative lipoic acid-binding regulatory protein [Woeseiaceae bacterium]|jgi:putative lipoic acid-binding regulatory protein
MTDTEKESLLEFPCSFPVKVMGRDQESFRRIAVEIVARHAGKLAEDAVTESSSRKGNFLSITITIQAKSQDQLDKLYNDLSSHEEILVAL